MRRLSVAVRAALALGLTVGSTQAAPATPRAEAQATLADVEAKKSEAAVAAEPIANAKKALERARSTREAGDAEGATLLGRVAREWAALALSLLRAVDAERRAEALEKRVAETETRATRARALLEETVARRGRARQELERLQGGGGGDGETSRASDPKGGEKTGGKKP